MKAIVNCNSIIDEISMFETYIKNNIPFCDGDEIRKLSFKLFELMEFQCKARAYFDFLKKCMPDSDGDRIDFTIIYGKLEDLLFWLVDEISSTEKALIR